MKCENLQHIGVFKFRGASNAVKLLGEEAELGLCTHSSGNQDKLYSCSKTKRRASIYYNAK